MSPHGRSEGRIHRNAKHGGFLISPHGRSEGRIHRNAKHEGFLISPRGRCEGRITVMRSLELV